MAIVNSRGLSLDDLLLKPGCSGFVPDEADIRTQITRNIHLNIPIVSAAMDTVTEHRTSIAMAREGGMGFIHFNIDIESQALEVRKVKKSESGIIIDPITIHPDQKVSTVLKLMKENNISGIPVVEKDNKLVGIVTNRDLRFETGLRINTSTIMTKENLVTILDSKKPTIEDAKEIFRIHKVEKLLVVDKNYRLVGLITVKDIEKIKKYPNACKDAKGRLRVGAAVGIGPDMIERTEALLSAGADIILIDTSHGHSDNVINAVEKLKSTFKNIELIAGNVGEGVGAEDLIKAGADGIKIGIGPGSICTTRIISGVGVPQGTAIDNCKHQCRKAGVPLIADGGIKFSGDITKAIGLGAYAVMIGSLLAGTDESPGEIILYQGKQFKVYRGMGSIDAMKEGGKKRYYQDDDDIEALIAQGIVSQIPHRGTLADNIAQLVGGLRVGMGLTGLRTIKELRTKARFYEITHAGKQESHVHSVAITKEAPNYKL